MIFTLYQEFKMLSFLLDIVLSKKAVPFLVLSFEVAHSTRGPALRVFRLNHTETPMEVSR